ncbi:hypothetical protein, partial [Pseudomonas hunanensis]|uniref:hypothetical protein n=1 Tax=Pseudomonas hunanensis TaxID=1247546 RepID=UPI00380CC355
PGAQRRGRMMGADGFGYFGHDQSNPPEGRKGDYAPPSRMNTYLMWMLTSKKQEARSEVVCFDSANRHLRWRR